MNGMTCREFDQVVHTFVRMELLDVNLREQALDHAARCPNCAERMSEAGNLAETTESAGKSMGELETPARVEVALLAAFRSHHRHAAWRRGFEWVAMGAVAALVLIFLWTGAGSSRSQTSPSPRKNISSQSGTPLDAQMSSPLQPEELTADADVQGADASAMESYAASDFVPVTFTEGISPEDAGMIVRVQLTRASLAELGYPLADTPDDDLILADVLVGEDGWPRAVKVVQ